jgi:hypothetical protein
MSCKRFEKQPNNTTKGSPAEAQEPETAEKQREKICTFSKKKGFYVGKAYKF